MTDSKFNEFVNIVKRLRKECPWDKAQTNESIRTNTIEEAYEVVHAIDDGDYEELKKELGDLMLHVVFHTEMAGEIAGFTIDDVIQSITDKLIRRHPHIFGDTEVRDADHVKENWEKIKMAEGRKSVLDGLPEALPALLRAQRMQEKASKVGFDWSEKADVWHKVEEEIREFRAAEEEGDNAKIEEELGDLLFAITNYSRFAGVFAEDALRNSIHKFERRFRYVEEKLAERGKKPSDSTLEEMDEIWNEIKAQE
ncbi:MAG: nucleoside triphosphate pyrophosphohydrolase [Ignavibacteriaceae bacterium]|nr:nucleoside triphosphate pyrophosphohydrolase [Ignavibacteriaceae bacterium]